MIIGIAGISLMAACGTQQGAAVATVAAGVSGVSGGTLTETGSTLLQPLMAEWAAAYHRQFPGTTVQVTGGGSTQGIDDASSGKADIGASDAYLSSGDLLKNPDLLNIPLAVSAQSVIYNLPELPPGTHVNLNGAVLAGMYGGSITTWDNPAIQAINPGVSLPAIPVVPVHRATGSGDTFIFTSYLSSEDAAWNDDVGYGTLVKWPSVSGERQASSSGTMVSQCAQIAGCVGYNGVSYLAQEQKAGLGEAALENTGGAYTLPSPATIAAELGYYVPVMPANESISMISGPGSNGYPVINFEYVIVSTRQPSAAKARQMQAFLRWVVSSPAATSLAATVGFQQLPSDVQRLSLTQIQEIR